MHSSRRFLGWGWGLHLQLAEFAMAAVWQTGTSSDDGSTLKPAMESAAAATPASASLGASRGADAFSADGDARDSSPAIATTAGITVAAVSVAAVS